MTGGWWDQLSAVLRDKTVKIVPVDQERRRGGRQGGREEDTTCQPAREGKIAYRSPGRLGHPDGMLD